MSALLLTYQSTQASVGQGGGWIIAAFLVALIIAIPYSFLLALFYVVTKRKTEHYSLPLKYLANTTFILPIVPFIFYSFLVDCFEQPHVGYISYSLWTISFVLALIWVVVVCSIGEWVVAVALLPVSLVVTVIFWLM